VPSSRAPVSPQPKCQLSARPVQTSRAPLANLAARVHAVCSTRVSKCSSATARRVNPTSTGKNPRGNVPLSPGSSVCLASYDIRDNIARREIIFRRSEKQPNDVSLIGIAGSEKRSNGGNATHLRVISLVLISTGEIASDTSRRGSASAAHPRISVSNLVAHLSG